MGKIASVVVLFLLLVGGCSVVGSYNRLNVLEQDVTAKWSQVENVYQRRADLIPNLMETVKGYAKHERETFTTVTEARAKVGQININAGELTPEVFQRFQAAQGELSSALSRLMVVMEKYPELKANTLFQDFMTELSGTENRIAVERRAYNLSAQSYNTTLRNFPTNLVNKFAFGYQEKPYFQAEEGAKKAPKVDFGTGSGDKK